MTASSPVVGEGKRPTAERRERMTTDAVKMRRARRRYVRACMAWLEADRERIYELGERMQAFGLFAPTTAECDIRSSNLTNLARAAGYENYKGRHQWLLKTGWCAFWGFSASKYRRAKLEARAAS